MLNGFELDAAVEDAEAEILAVAAGQRTREQLTAWVRGRLKAL
jgi:prophage maintenance system killer protein